MADRLSLKQRMIASLMEIFGPPTRMRRKFAERFPVGVPPSRLTIYRIYNKFLFTGSVADNYKGNAGRPRTGTNEMNIAEHNG